MMEDTHAENYVISTPPSPIISAHEISSSHSASRDESPRRRFGDLAGIVAAQPLGQMVAEAAADAAGAISGSIPNNPFTLVDGRLKNLEMKTKAYASWTDVTDERILILESHMLEQSSRDTVHPDVIKADSKCRTEIDDLNRAVAYLIAKDKSTDVNSQL